MDILSKLKTGRLYFDGGYGTCLQSHGLKPGEQPELWNITKPEVVTGLHLDYLNAGADVVTTNTFGANILKFNGNDGKPPLKEVISAAVSNAKEAVAKCGLCDKYVALDIGPTGRLLEPMGDLSFDEAVGIFAESVKIGAECGVDLIIIETMNDSYETKAAVIAAKENSTLPIFVTNAYERSGNLMTGASPAVMVAMLEGLGVNAIGVNCSFGPDKMLSIVKELVEKSSTPIIANPNAGLPVVKDGVTSYEVLPEDFAEIMCEIAESGATVLGGCCGTTPEHIRALKERTSAIEAKPIENKGLTVAASYSHTVEFGKKPVVVGERINPTGKPALSQAIQDGEFDYVLDSGFDQKDAGAEILDVNVGVPCVDEEWAMAESVKILQSSLNLPLQIDTINPDALEAAIRIYNGKAIINSVNGKKTSMDAIFPIAAKYGGVVIALLCDENGIPQDADSRIEIAKKILDTAKEYGIAEKDLIFDPLTLAACVYPEGAEITLECVKRLSEMGHKTSLGISNISFCMPERGKMNAEFLTKALNCGLNAAILDPTSAEVMDAYNSFLETID